MKTSSADEIIALLGLLPHPEGGHYRETWRAPARQGERASGTAIHFLLRAGEISHWHRVDATEIWHWHSGAPLALRVVVDSEPQELVLGNDLILGQRPQIVVDRYAWQSAETLGAWTLVGCTVSPAFEFSGFELAPAGWVPGGD